MSELSTDPDGLIYDDYDYNDTLSVRNIKNEKSDENTKTGPNIYSYPFSPKYEGGSRRRKRHSRRRRVTNKKSRKNRKSRKSRRHHRRR